MAFFFLVSSHSVFASEQAIDELHRETYDFCTFFLEEYSTLYENNEISGDALIMGNESHNSENEQGHESNTEGNESDNKNQENGNSVQIEEQNQSFEIRINEIYSNPLSGEKEWVELYNPNNFITDLTDWKVEEGSGSATRLDFTLQPNGYGIVYRSGLNNSGDEVILKNSSGDVISRLLYGEWNGNIGEAVSGKGHVLAYSEGQYILSQTKTPGEENYITEVIKQTEDDETEESGDNDDNQDEQEFEESINDDDISGKNQDSEPGSELQDDDIDDVASEYMESDKDSNSDVNESEFDLNVDESFENHDLDDKNAQISFVEVYANPFGVDTGKEYIKLSNMGQETVNLNQWYIKDDSKSGIYYFEDFELESGQEIALYNSDLGFSLGNSSEKLYIFNSRDEQVDSVSYSNFEEGQTMIRLNGEWSIQGDAQKEDSGDLQKEDSSTEDDISIFEEMTISDVYEQQVDTYIKITGIVSVGSNILGKDIAYIQDQTAGIQINVKEVDSISLTQGQSVEVLGEVSIYYGERRVIVDDIKILQESQIINPIMMTSEFDQNFYRGKFVQHSGIIIEKRGAKLIFEHDGNEYTIKLKDGAGISSKDFKSGQDIIVKGVYIEKKDAFEILPFEKDHVVVQQEESHQESMQENVDLSQLFEDDKLGAGFIIDKSDNGSGNYMLIITSTILIGVGMLFYIKRRFGNHIKIW